MPFLVFQLWAPLVSWGDIAVGERRLSSVAPSKSALLGILAGALGIERMDDESWSHLSRSYSVATRVDHSGSLLVDYHTTQVPPASAFRKKRPQSRREELSIPKEKLGTILSYREYLNDQTVLACVWESAPDARWSLEKIATALKEPAFSPFLGRKSCPPGLPFNPRVIEADNPVEALQAIESPSIFGEEKRASHRTFRWEHFPELRSDQIVSRRDQSTLRSRWQFADRQERIRTERVEVK